MTELSGEFLRALEEVCQDKKQVQVGGVFVTFAPRIKRVYGAYCRNHDSASALYEKVSSTSDCVELLEVVVDCYAVHGHTQYCRQHTP